MKSRLKNNWLKILSLFFLFVIVSIYSNLPIITKGTFPLGTDLPFHLNRIQGLADNVNNGIFHPSINTAYLNGFGYPVDLFYGSLTIIPIAIMVAMGVGLIASLKIYSIFVSFFTLSTMFYASKTITKNTQASIIASILYLFSNYRLRDYFYRGAIGSWLAFIFLPLVFLGLYMIIKGDSKKWYLLVIGFLGIFFSHLLTAVITSIIAIIFIIFNFKTLVKAPNRLTKLVLSGIFIILLSMYYWFPMLEQMLSYDYYGKENTWVFIDKSGNYPFFDIFSMSLNNETIVPYILSIGLVSTILSRVFIIDKKDLEFSLTRNIHLADILVVVSLGLVFISSTAFPWKLFVHYFNFIQFPHRFLPYAIVFLSISGGIYYNYFQNKTNKKNLLFLITLCILLLIPYNQMIEYKTNNKLIPMVDSFDIGVGKEYIPSEVDLEKLRATEKNLKIVSGEASFSDVSINNQKITGTISTNTPIKVQVPLIYYKGYTIKYTSAKGTKVINPQISENHLIIFSVQDSGKFVVNYTRTTIQKLSLYVSLISIPLFLLCILVKNRRKKSNH